MRAAHGTEVGELGAFQAIKGSEYLKSRSIGNIPLPFPNAFTLSIATEKIKSKIA
jgi:hypothetical protein